MTIPIYNFLNKTKEQYQEEHFERYMRWCISYSNRVVDDRDLQKLLANTAISNYYNAQFRELEIQFMEAVKTLPITTRIESVQAIYNGITTQIFNHYPSALFDEARKMSLSNWN
jgi:hypothetical protein